MRPDEITSEYVCGVFAVERESYESRRWPHYLEDPNAPLDDTALVAGGMSTNTGTPITHTTALELDPVWQAVSLISGDVANRRLYLRKRIEDTTASKIATNHPVNRLLATAPNDELNAVEFWRRFMVHLLLWGNGYIWIIRDAEGNPVELVNLLPDRTVPYRIPVPELGATQSHLIYRTEVSQPEAQLLTLDHFDVIHVEWITNIDRWGLEGHDVTRRARHSWALGLAQNDFASKFFKNGGRVGGILMVPAAVKKSSRDTIEEGFRKSYAEPFKTVVLRDGAKFAEAQHSFVDTQVVEGMEQTARNVARRFQLPPSKLGLADSTSYNSKSEDNRAYLDQTLSIFFRLITAECDYKLLTRREQNRHFTQHDLTDLLRLDPQSQANVHQTYINARVLSPNEVRADLELLPYEGGDEYTNPAITPGQTDDGQTDEGETTEETTDETTEETDGEERSELDLIRRRAAYEITNTIRRKATLSYRHWRGWFAKDGEAIRPLIRSLVGGEEMVDRAFRLVAELKVADVADRYERIDKALQTFESEF